jgi:phosphomannomutase
MSGMEKVDHLRKAFAPNSLTDVRWQYVHYDEMHDLGMEAADLLERGNIVLGADSRKSSSEMLEAFKGGYQKNGGKVLNCGIHCTTPMIEYLGSWYGLTSVMITASHLDETWQGIKIRSGGTSNKKAAHTGEEAFRDYVRSFLKKDFGGLPVTVDYFEGSAARTFPVIAARTNMCVIEAFNAGMTGDYSNFPSHSPDPTIPENLVTIIEIMKNNDSCLGIAFDGDGDRHVFILRQDNEVRAIDPVLLTAISAMHYKQPGIFVLGPFMVPAEKAISSTGHKMVRVHRGRPHIIRNILDLKCRGERVHKGMESSYHGFDSEGFDDGIRQVIEFCTYLQKGIDIKKAKKLIHYRYTLEMRVTCEDDTLFRESVIPALIKSGKERGLPMDRTDGIWAKGSFVARKSSREDVVSFLFYGEDPKKEMESVKRVVSPFYRELADDLEKKFHAMKEYKEEFYW